MAMHFGDGHIGLEGGVGDGQGMVWSRSGWAGSQRAPIQWGGDPQASWNGLAGSILGGLSWGFTGAPFYSHDIGGFYGGPPDAELFVRWVQAGVLGPFCRFHGIGPREPWYFGEEAEAITKEWLALRYRLLPYLQRQVKEAALSGLPVMRGMPLAFPEDRRAWGFELQYMLGDHLLVAPVVQPGGWVTLYLPEGGWYDYFTGERVEGGRVITQQAPLNRLPVYVREGAVLAEGPAVQHTGEINKANRIEKLRVFGVPAKGALDHEADIGMNQLADRRVLAFAPGIECDVYGARHDGGDGKLDVFLKEESDATP
jgi:alpha-D-xyloside xylohydrolase